MRMRRGITIAEIIVALVLGSIVLGLVARSVTAQRRNERTISGSSRGASTVDEAIGVLAAALERVSSADTVRLRGDTAIEFGLAIGGGLPCAAGGDSLVFRDSTATVWWESPADSGDSVDALIGSDWVRAEIVSAGTRTASTGECAGSQRVIRIRPLPIWSGELPLVRVTRRTRFMVYRGGDGAWWFGERTCGVAPSACSSAQPVSGPLDGAQALRFAIDTTRSIPFVAVSVTAGKTVRNAVLPLRP